MLFSDLYGLRDQLNRIEKKLCECRKNNSGKKASLTVGSIKNLYDSSYTTLKENIDKLLEIEGNPVMISTGDNIGGAATIFLNQALFQTFLLDLIKKNPTFRDELKKLLGTGGTNPNPPSTNDYIKAKDFKVILNRLNNNYSVENYLRSNYSASFGVKVTKAKFFIKGSSASDIPNIADVGDGYTPLNANEFIEFDTLTDYYFYSKDPLPNPVEIKYQLANEDETIVSNVGTVTLDFKTGWDDGSGGTSPNTNKLFVTEPDKLNSKGPYFPVYFLPNGKDTQYISFTEELSIKNTSSENLLATDIFETALNLPEDKERFIVGHKRPLSDEIVIWDKNFKIPANSTVTNCLIGFTYKLNATPEKGYSVNVACGEDKRKLVVAYPEVAHYPDILKEPVVSLEDGFYGEHQDAYNIGLLPNATDTYHIPIAYFQAKNLSSKDEPLNSAIWYGPSDQLSTDLMLLFAEDNNNLIIEDNPVIREGRKEKVALVLRVNKKHIDKDTIKLTRPISFIDKKVYYTKVIAKKHR